MMGTTRANTDVGAPDSVGQSSLKMPHEQPVRVDDVPCLIRSVGHTVKRPHMRYGGDT